MREIKHSPAKNPGRVNRGNTNWLLFAARENLGYFNTLLGGCGKVSAPPILARACTDNLPFFGGQKKSLCPPSVFTSRILENNTLLIWCSTTFGLNNCFKTLPHSFNKTNKSFFCSHLKS